ncbi:MAG TPA: helix-turn-helix domain-containing protein [Ignavibacteriales bacterium]|nr:helix-turn-helix domain-containing protein [Ignavibacteriales bacterium]
MNLINKKEITELKDLAGLISSRRKLLKLTQEDLAGIAGISLRSLKSIEAGEGNPGFNQLLKLMDVLGLKFSAENK